MYEHPVFLAIESAEINLALWQRPTETLADLIQLARRCPAALAELEAIDRLERLWQPQAGPRVESRPRRDGEPAAHCNYCGARAWDAHLVYDGAGRDHPDEWSCKDLDACIARHDEALRRDDHHPVAVRVPGLEGKGAAAEAVVRRVKAAKPAVAQFNADIRQQIEAERRPLVRQLPRPDV